MQLLEILVIYVLLFAVVLSVGRNVLYSVRKSAVTILEKKDFRGTVKPEEAETLLIWERDDNGRNGREEMGAIFSQMRIPFAEKESKEFTEDDLQGMETVVLSVTDLGTLGTNLTKLLDWVYKGHSLLFLYPPYNEATFLSIADKVGITAVENALAKVEGLHFTSSFMPGYQRDLSIVDPYRSSLDVTLDDSCEVFVQAKGSSETPLIWRRAFGKGRIVFDNLSFLEKAYRGFHCAAFSLLEETCVWPVINGSTFYIDDFPSPVPEGDSQFIQHEFGMDIKDFYTHHWWKDVYNLSKKYNIRYTGLVIEDYSAQVSGVFPRNKDITRFQYFGNMLLREGGELGFHGYNHMPLVPESFDYIGQYDSYRQWESVDAMRDSLTELSDFCHDLFPNEVFETYVPPSNIISEEGRKLLAEDFPEIRAIASLYLPDDNDVSYSQDFTVTEDGMVQTPRIISGYVLDDYMRAAAMSELYFHCVNTHFQHPDDCLDTDRGAALGWTELFRRLTDYVEWLHNALPQLRNLTGSELTGAVQRYDALEIRREKTDRGIRLELGGFCDEAWFYLRINDGRPGRVTGGSISEAADGLYLVKAVRPDLEIEINR
ncbi:MAG: DUF2194 domain-containing protein [Lachnospiraceae bacterium]|nr:DUF2194 domain-containing protein [Lachnospiraceae bacterium]